MAIEKIGLLFISLTVITGCDAKRQAAVDGAVLDGATLDIATLNDAAGVVDSATTVPDGSLGDSATTDSAPSWSCATIGPVDVDRAGRYVSMAVDGTSNVHLSYLDAQHAVQYDRRDSNGVLLAHEAVSKQGIAASNAHLAIGPNGVVHVLYHDNTNGALQLATRANGGFSHRQLVTASAPNVLWAKVAVDDHGDLHYAYADHQAKALIYAEEIGGFSGYRMDPLKAFDPPVLAGFVAIATSGITSYIAYAADGGLLKIGSFRAGFPRIDVLDASNSEKVYVALAIDPTGTVHVVAQDIKNKALLYFSNKTGAFFGQKLQFGDPGFGASLAVNAQGKILIAHGDYSQNAFVVTDNISGTIRTRTVESGVRSSWSAAVLDQRGRLHLAYDDQATNRLRYAVVCP